MCLGDFNEILMANEKQGWLDRSERQMQSFCDALDFCCLKDLGFNGFPFTWCNKRARDQNFWIRLDRDVALVDWILQFPSSSIHHLDAFHSNHKPILLCSDSEINHFTKKVDLSASKQCGLRMIPVTRWSESLGEIVRWLG